MKFYDGLEFVRADMLVDTDIDLSFRARFYSVEYIHLGALTLFMNNKEFYHEAPCVFHTFPGALIEYDTKGGKQRRTHYWTCFTGSRVQNYIDGELLRINTENPFREVVQPDHFLHMIQNLNMLVNTGQQDKAVLQLEHVLFSLCEQDNQKNKASFFYADSINKLLVNIIKNPETEWDFVKEASKLSITLNHFNRLFRKITKTSPRQFVIYSRLQKAAELLFNTEITMKEIASIVGIENEFYFSRLFKKKYSSSPTDYRQEFRITSDDVK